MIDLNRIMYLVGGLVFLLVFLSFIPEITGKVTEVQQNIQGLPLGTVVWPIAGFLVGIILVFGIVKVLGETVGVRIG
ncbi:MAG: hypothetical protein QXP13_06260 [Candidatus Methanomethylicia archaeon]